MTKPLLPRRETGVGATKVFQARSPLSYLRLAYCNSYALCRLLGNLERSLLTERFPPEENKNREKELGKICIFFFIILFFSSPLYIYISFHLHVVVSHYAVSFIKKYNTSHGRYIKIILLNTREIISHRVETSATLHCYLPYYDVFEDTFVL